MSIFIRIIRMRAALSMLSAIPIMVCVSCGGQNKKSENLSSGSALKELRMQKLPVDESERGSGSLSSHEVKVALARLGVVLDDDAEYSVKKADYQVRNRHESGLSLFIVFPIADAKKIFDEASAYLKGNLPEDSFIKEKIQDSEMGELGVGTYHLTRRGENHKRKTDIWLDPKKGLFVVSIGKGDV